MVGPTCETCLHWDGGKHIGECRLAVVPGVLTPVTRYFDSCDAHPDFPAWIAAQKQPAIKEGDALYWSASKQEYVVRDEAKRE